MKNTVVPLFDYSQLKQIESLNRITGLHWHAVPNSLVDKNGKNESLERINVQASLGKAQ